MGGRRRKGDEPPGPWLRAVVVLLTLGVAGHGILCMIRGRLVSEEVVLEGAPARLVGAVVAALALVTLVRSVYRWRKDR
jgi:hypothetical protein